MASSQSCSRFMVPVIMPISTQSNICSYVLVYVSLHGFLINHWIHTFSKVVVTSELQFVQYVCLIYVNFTYFYVLYQIKFTISVQRRIALVLCSLTSSY
jgi:hypothetical protein